MLLPKESISLLHQSIISRRAVRSSFVYKFLLLFVMLCFAMLPFIKVDISVQTRGMMAPAEKRSSLVSPVAGKVIFSLIQENQAVKEGDTLLIVDHSILLAEADMLLERISENRALMNDFDLLQSEKPQRFHSELGRSLAADYSSQLQGLKLDIKRLETEFKRNLQLYQAKAIPRIEKEESEDRYRKILSDYEQFIYMQSSDWKRKKLALKKENESLYREYKQVKQKIALHYILAPTSGILINCKALGAHYLVNNVSVLAELTPNSVLVAECYVNPSDIGQIRAMQSASLQIDTYNHMQWGTVSGHIQSISDDIILFNQEAKYRVIIDLNEYELSLVNGQKAALKKGMSFTARLMVNRKSLLQLFFDKTDELLNPVNFQSHV